MSASYRKSTAPVVNDAAPLHVSLYDRVASWLVALLIFVGVTVFCLFVIWLTNRLSPPLVAVPIQAENLGGSPEGVLGDSLQLDGPEMEEISREAELEEPQIQQSLALVETVVAAHLAELDDPQLSDDPESGKAGKSEGTGENPALGEGGGSAGGVPRYKRWVILYEAGSLEEYARQLDFFKIELAAVGQGRVEYASGFSQPQPRRRTADRNAQEDRLYMSWTEGSLKKFDLQLLRKAGIDPSGKLVLQFYPPDVEAQLAQLEVAYRGHQPKQIRRTYFKVQRDGSGYRFVVVDQELLGT